MPSHNRPMLRFALQFFCFAIASAVRAGSHADLNTHSGTDCRGSQQRGRLPGEKSEDVKAMAPLVGVLLVGIPLAVRRCGIL